MTLEIIEPLRDLYKDEVRKKWIDTIDSIKYAIEYFRSFLKIPVSEILPYDSLIVPFAYFYYNNKYKNPNLVQQEYINQYFWKASLSYRFISGTSTKLQQDAKRMLIIKKGSPPKYDFKPQIVQNAIKIMNFSTANSYCKAILCLYAQQEPLSFKNASKVILGNAWLKRSNSRNYHHFFPKNYLKLKKIQHGNSIVNITYVSQGLNLKDIKDDPPSIYLLKFKKTNPDMIKTMRTHLIDNINDYGIWKDDYDKFLEKRAKRIYDELIRRTS